MNKLMFPYAIEKDSLKVVSPSEVKNGKECSCICFQCGQNMIAINNPENKQKPHFRHDADSNCQVNFESYLHWITKEVFKRLDILYIPLIAIEEITVRIKYILASFFEENKTPKKLRELITLEVVESIPAVPVITIQEVSIEESFSSSTGDIKVDIVLRFKNKRGEERILFIEPYFSNRIDAFKLSKLIALNISTISINLTDFIAKKSHVFQLKDLRAFLVNDLKSKKWEYFNFDKILSDKKIADIKERLCLNVESIKMHKVLMNDIKDLYSEKEIIEQQMKELSTKLALINNGVRKKYEEIDRIEYL